MGRYRKENQHPKQFGEKGKELYNKDNLDRIKRFADAPVDYIEERIELNKEVLRNYHKLHQSILLALLTSFYFSLLVLSLSQGKYSLSLILIIIGIMAIPLQYYKNISFHFMRLIGLLRVIRDSEIEVYYLSMIKKNRMSEV